MTDCIMYTISVCAAAAGINDRWKRYAFPSCSAIWGHQNFVRGEANGREAYCPKSIRHVFP